MPQTDLTFLSQGCPWPPPAESKRFARYEQNRKLFEGEQQDVLGQWIKLLRDDIKATYEIVLNWHKRVSTLWADLLLGEPPKFTSDPEQAVDRYATQRFRLNAYEAALDVSRFGDGILKVRLKDGQAVIEPNTPAVWIPVIDPSNIKETTAHVLAWVIKKQAGSKEIAFLRAEIHTPGKIINKLFFLKDGYGGGKGQYTIEREIDLGYLPEFKMVPVEQETGVKRSLVIPIHNLITSDRATGMDDYKDIDAIIQELMTRFSQIAKILDKHASPTVYGPDNLQQVDPVTGVSRFVGLSGYIGLAPEDNPPAYMVYDGQLTAAFQQIETLMNQLYAISETSPAAFGQLQQGLAESGSALRRLMMAPLAKVNRMRLSFDEALKDAIITASELETANGNRDAKRINQVTINWQDGLPLDDTEQANNMNIKRAAGVISRRRALQEMGLEGRALDDELAAIVEEEKATLATGPEVTMPILGGGTGGGE